jgi:hypothetical protein
MTEDRVREIIREELAAGCPPWADDKPTINRDLRGWVLVTDAGGRNQVWWASERGVSTRDDCYYVLPWEDIEVRDWKVEPFQTGYSESDISKALSALPMGERYITNIIFQLRRLKEDT